MNVSGLKIKNVSVYSLSGEATSHLVVFHGRSVLVDCHSVNIKRWMERRGLPFPELILHTHVDPVNCREAGLFPSARILVHEELAELASNRDAYECATRTVWKNPAEWSVTMGREKYGVAGSVTVFPPDKLLELSGTFSDGERILWNGLVFEVVPLPGHGPAHVGFRLELEGGILALFSGDLLRHPGCLVNVYDLEKDYGSTTIFELPQTLRKIAGYGQSMESCDRPTIPFFPANGPVIVDGPASARVLADAINNYRQALEWRSARFTPASQVDYPFVGRYARIHRGVYQISNFGNCILLVDDQGRGLMVDPGPCDFESPTRADDFMRDLDLFESECGLRTIDTVLVTHIHGDHYDLVSALKARYPGCRTAAWDLVARVIEAPWDYPYSALLPWYNLGMDHVPVDDVLLEDMPFDWHGIPVQSLHLPGHCYCHAAYLMTFNGMRLAFTGDTIQSRGDSCTLDFIIANHSVPDEYEGVLKAYQTMAVQDVDINLGGHGSHFTNCRAMYEESLRRIEYAVPYLRKLVADGNLQQAFRRPSLLRVL